VEDRARIYSEKRNPAHGRSKLYKKGRKERSKAVKKRGIISLNGLSHRRLSKEEQEAGRGGKNFMGDYSKQRDEKGARKGKRIPNLILSRGSERGPVPLTRKKEPTSEREVS